MAIISLFIYTPISIMVTLLGTRTIVFIVYLSLISILIKFLIVGSKAGKYIGMEMSCTFTVHSSYIYNDQISNEMSAAGNYLMKCNFRFFF